MFVGPTGTGKSVYVQQKLMNDMPKELYTAAFINLSAQTTANMTQVTNEMHESSFCFLKRHTHSKEYLFKIITSCTVLPVSHVCISIQKSFDFVYI